MEKDSLVLTRPFHCPECERLQRPVEEYKFIVFGGTTGEVYLEKATYRTHTWITPHLIFYDGVHTKEYVEIIVACCICGCGLKITRQTEKEFWFEIIKARKYRLNHFSWEALKTYKDSDYLLNKHRFNRS